MSARALLCARFASFWIALSRSHLRIPQALLNSWKGPAGQKQRRAVNGLFRWAGLDFLTSLPVRSSERRAPKGNLFVSAKIKDAWGMECIKRGDREERGNFPLFASLLGLQRALPSSLRSSLFLLSSKNGPKVRMSCLPRSALCEKIEPLLRTLTLNRKALTGGANSPGEVFCLAEGCSNGRKIDDLWHRLSVCSNWVEARNKLNKVVEGKKVKQRIQREGIERSDTAETEARKMLLLALQVDPYEACRAVCDLCYSLCTPVSV